MTDAPQYRYGHAYSASMADACVTYDARNNPLRIELALEAGNIPAARGKWKILKRRKSQNGDMVITTWDIEPADDVARETCARLKSRTITSRPPRTTPR
jgi:hypothetical protein